MSGRDIDPAFVQLGAKNGLTRRTMQMLFENGFSNKNLLSMIPERQLRDIDIPNAQKLRLRKLVEELLLAEQMGEAEAEDEAAATEENEDIMNENDLRGELMAAVGAEEGESGEPSGKLDPLIPTDNLLSKMMRPHESVFGMKTKDANFLQFLYANLLCLENLYRTDKDQSVGYLHHLHLLTLKLMQQYPVEDVFKFDFAVRSKIDSGEFTWESRSNISPDDELLKDNFSDEHLQKWKKMKKMSSRKLLANAFKADRCLAWNYSKDGKECTNEECKFIHVCLACSGKHALVKCPNNLSDKKTKGKEKTASSTTPRANGTFAKS